MQVGDVFAALCPPFFGAAILRRSLLAGKDVDVKLRTARRQGGRCLLRSVFALGKVVVLLFVWGVPLPGVPLGTAFVRCCRGAAVAAFGVYLGSAFPAAFALAAPSSARHRQSDWQLRGRADRGGGELRFGYQSAACQAAVGGRD